MESNYSRWTFTRLILTTLIFGMIALGWHWLQSQPYANCGSNLDPYPIMNVYADYDTFNREAFGNELPQAKLEWKEMPHLLGKTVKKDDGKFYIYLNPDLIRCQRTGDQTLLHEMCHIKTWKLNPKTDHGPEWQGCMHEQAMNGIMDGIW